MGDPRRIAHLSDLHFGREDPAAVLDLRRDLLDQRPDFVVVSGDLTQRARSAQFRLAVAFLQSLGSPWLAVPGNHDIPLDPIKRLTRPFHNYQRIVGPSRPPPHVEDDLTIFGLNTVLPWVWKGGLVRGHQLEHLATWSRLAGSRLRVVAAHHPFTRPEATGHSLVRGWSKAIQVMEESGVDVLLTGHQHVAGHSETRAFVAEGPHRLVVVRAGTSVSHRTRGTPNSYNVLRVDANAVHVEERRFVSGQFQATAVQDYPRLRRQPG